ncbi:MAG: formate dehydrogenase accessory protein FdhE [Desulfuromonadales bacterium]|nr:formate dehydrogenase accessory protein FdhE [Desulfuromonadales bacterium]MDW7758734.1 formate dehydrogenase accessory protein FdhE [Desulfuromonadales bacterium]
MAKRQQRLRELRGKYPDFSEVFNLYGDIYALMETRVPDYLQVEDEAAMAPSSPGDRPLLRGDNLQVDAAGASGFMLDLIDILKQHGQQGGEDLDRMAKGIATAAVDVVTLLRASLERDRLQITGEAESLQVDPAMVEYVGGMALSLALQLARERGLRVDSSDWNKRFCPLCGGAPTMGELVGDEGRMVLHCGTCGESWASLRHACATCGNVDGKTLEYFTAGPEKGYRVHICRQCDSYLKVIDSREAGADLPMDLEDVATLYLDVLARREGFTRGKRDGAPADAAVSTA